MLTATLPHRSIPTTALPNDLQPASLPNHIAIIMDGNGRWAKQRGLPRIIGHRQGVKALKNIVRCCNDWGIGTMTVYAFSTENWQRPPAEVEFLMGLFERVLLDELVELHDQGVRLSFIGDRTGLPDRLQQIITQVTAHTAANSGLHLVIAVNYGGRDELVRACQQIADRVQRGELTSDAINATTIAAHLMTQEIPDPDLLIRTSDELRLSNFLPWQLAYTELYFARTLWPDFGVAELHQALCNYQQRDRRFGRVKSTQP